MARRNYKKEYKNYHSKPEQRKRRSQRTMARRKAIKAGKVKKGDKKDIHHTSAKRKGKLDNSKTKVLSRSQNRSMNRHKPGEKQVRRKGKS